MKVKEKLLMQLMVSEIKSAYSHNPEVQLIIKRLIDMCADDDTDIKKISEVYPGIDVAPKIKANGSVSYTAVVGPLYTSIGKRTTRSFTAATEKAAFREALTFQQGLNKVRNKYILPDEVVAASEEETVDSGPTVSEWLDTYIKTLDIRTTTKKDYYSMRKRFIDNPHESLPKIAKLKISDITTEHVEDLKMGMKELGFSHKTVNGMKNLLSSSFKYAIVRDLLQVNVFSLIKGVKATKKLPAFLQEEELNNLLKCAVGNPIEAFVNVLAMTGMRRGEARGLSWEDINFEKGLINIGKQIHEGHGTMEPIAPKTDSSYRTVEVDPELHIFTLLKTLKDNRRFELGDKDIETELIFSYPDGRAFGQKYLYQHLEEILDKVSFNKSESVGFHTLRHTFITLMLAQGEDVKKVSRWVGHANVKITYDIYAHAIRGEGKKASTKFGTKAYSGVSEVAN